MQLDGLVQGQREEGVAALKAALPMGGQTQQGFWGLQQIHPLLSFQMILKKGPVTGERIICTQGLDPDDLEWEIDSDIIKISVLGL